MKRRKFIQNASLATLVATFGSSVLMSACKKEGEDIIQPPESGFKGKVIIIGAGASGLYAGLTLKNAGIEYEILEATNHIGGRIRKVEDFADFTIDLGAQWLHGEKTFLKKVADNNNINTYVDWAEWVHQWFEGEWVESLPEEYAQFKEIAWGGYENLPDISFLEYAQQNGFSEDIFKLLELMASTSGTSANRVSMRGYAKEVDKWTYGDEGYWFAESLYDFYDQVVIQKVKENISLNTIVKKVEIIGNEISVYDLAGNVRKADKVIICVPIPILKDGDIEFIPALPAEKTEAFSKIGMDQGAKVFLKFSEQFYEGSIINGALGTKYVDAGYGKNTNDHVLLTSYFGEQADYYNSISQDDVIQELLADLDSMFNGQASASFQDAIVQNWGQEPFIRGAYSYQPVGVGNAREIAASSINKQLFFAGEAMHTEGAYQIIDGAAETGYMRALEIING